MTWQPLFEDQGIPLAVMGILVVFVALSLVSLFITALPHLMALLARSFPEETRAAEPVKSDELPEETVAVIAAAVMEVVSGHHRIVHIGRVTPGDLNWSKEGRRVHHSSHKPR